jgi:hypothetical protein
MNQRMGLFANPVKISSAAFGFVGPDFLSDFHAVPLTTKFATCLTVYRQI